MGWFSSSPKDVFSTTMYKGPHLCDPSPEVIALAQRIVNARGLRTLSQEEKALVQNNKECFATAVYELSTISTLPANAIIANQIMKGQIGGRRKTKRFRRKRKTRR